MKNNFWNAILTLALASTAGNSIAKELKLADFQPSTHPYVANVYTPMINQVKAATNGELSIRLFMAGELGSGPGQQFNRAVNGVVDIAFALPGYTASSFPKTLLTELPGVIDPQTGTERVLANLSSLSNEYRRVVLLGLWLNAPNVLLSSSKPIRSLNDLKGMKIRTPSRNAGLVLESWGATPVSMPAPDIYNAMQTGVIDGAMIDGTTLQTFKLAEVTKYVTQGMKPTVSSFFLVANRDSFNGLPPQHQQALLGAGKTASLSANKVQLEGAAKALTAFAATAGKEVITLSAAQANAFNAASEKVTQRIISEGDANGLEASAHIKALQK